MEIIEKYLEKVHLPEIIMKKKMASYKKHLDIAKEFEYWIVHKQYFRDNCVEIEGYTAEKLAKLSEFLNGEGAFGLLIELREDSGKALKKISRGFKIK